MADQQNAEGDGASEYIHLRVVGQATFGIFRVSSTMDFRVKMSMHLVKLKKYYSNRVGVPVTSLRFIFDGRRINDEETPQQLEMENDDIVEVYLEQTGGIK